MKKLMIGLVGAVALAGCCNCNWVDSDTTFAQEVLAPYVKSGELPGAINVFYMDGVQVAKDSVAYGISTNILMKATFGGSEYVGCLESVIFRYSCHIDTLSGVHHEHTVKSGHIVKVLIAMKPYGNACPISLIICDRERIGIGCKDMIAYE